MKASSIKRLYARCIPLCDSTFFTLSAPTVNLTLTRRHWMGFALMALLTLTSTLVGWYNLRFISQVEKDNTQSLIPTMYMEGQFREASAWELFAAQNLTSADNEKMWQAQGRMLTAQSLKINALLQALREQGAQGRMLTAQSLKINALLQALREQGFDTTAIEQQEQEISRSLRQQGEQVGQRLQLRKQQQQLSQHIVAAADEIARLAQGQANNAATSAGATQAGIYDLIEQHQRQPPPERPRPGFTI